MSGHHSIEALVLMHVRSSGPVDIVSCYFAAKEQALGFDDDALVNGVFAGVGALIRAGAIEVYNAQTDPRHFSFVPTSSAPAHSASLDLLEGRLF